MHVRCNRSQLYHHHQLTSKLQMPRKIIPAFWYVCNAATTSRKPRWCGDTQSMQALKQPLKPNAKTNANPTTSQDPPPIYKRLMAVTIPGTCLTPGCHCCWRQSGPDFVALASRCCLAIQHELLLTATCSTTPRLLPDYRSSTVKHCGEAMDSGLNCGEALRLWLARN